MAKTADNKHGPQLFIHVKDAPEANWRNLPYAVSDFVRLPCVGECFAFESDGHLYRVEMVVHVPASAVDADYQAEIYAVKVSNIDLVTAAGNRFDD